MVDKRQLFSLVSLFYLRSISPRFYWRSNIFPADAVQHVSVRRVVSVIVSRSTRRRSQSHRAVSTPLEFRERHRGWRRDRTKRVPAIEMRKPFTENMVRFEHSSPPQTSLFWSVFCRPTNRASRPTNASPIRR